MKELIAKFGYVSCYAFGFPKQRLEENFEGYFGVGMFWLVILGIALLACLVLITIVLNGGKKDEIH